MRKFPVIQGYVAYIVLVVLTYGLVLTATQAYAYYGRHFGGHHSYGYHGGHFRHSYHNYEYGYYPYYYRSRSWPFYGHSSHRYDGDDQYRHRDRDQSNGGRGEQLGGPDRSPPTGGESTASPGTLRGGDAATSGASAYGGASTMPQGTGTVRETTVRRISPATEESGWTLLADGRYPQALSTFATEASRRPKEGEQKVGYALSAAASGNLQRGVWAMRRALRIDPDSLHYLILDESLRSRIEQLVIRYKETSDRTISNADASFMLAALHYLLSDTESAQAAIDQALSDDDHRVSTRNLGELLDKSYAPDGKNGAGAAS